jgi:hypothetical protein
VTSCGTQVYILFSVESDHKLKATPVSVKGFCEVGI